MEKIFIGDEKEVFKQGAVWFFFFISVDCALCLCKTFQSLWRIFRTREALFRGDKAFLIVIFRLAVQFFLRNTKK